MNAKSNSRRPGQKAEDIRLVWKEHAPETEFAGIKLADLEAALGSLQEAAENLKVSEHARSVAVKTRDEKLDSLRLLVNKVVRGVQAHPEHGEDSAVYRAMGYVPLSERRSGLIRVPKTTAQEKTVA